MGDEEIKQENAIAAEPDTKCQTPVTKEQTADEKHADHITYNSEGEAIYTDPSTQSKYKWEATSNSWQPLENEHYKWCATTQKWLPKVTATSATETEHFRWDADKQEWVAKAETPISTRIKYDIDEDGERVYTDKDGVVFFWDEQRSAWFPKIDNDMLARYQMSYGFVDESVPNTPDTDLAQAEAEKASIAETKAATKTAPKVPSKHNYH